MVTALPCRSVTFPVPDTSHTEGVSEVARYPLVSYLFSLFLPTGVIITRIACPDCGSLHYEIEHGEECLCFGCGIFLSVEGLELLTSEVPNGWSDEEEEKYSGEDPDHPSFWYYSDN
jgi:hypothetical protein